MEKNPNGLTTQIPERRIQPRYAIDDRATLLLLNRGVSVSGEIIDLSLNGCRLQVPREFRVSSSARVEVTFKINGIAFRLSGVTQWTDGRQVLGIRFGEMSSRRRDELSELLTEIEADVAAKAAQAEANSQTAEEQEAEKPSAQQSNPASGAATPVIRERLAAERRFQQTPAQEELKREKLAQAKRAELGEAQRKVAEQAAPVRAGMSVPGEQRWTTAPTISSAVAKVAPEAPVEGGDQGRDSMPVLSAKSAMQERRAQARHSVDSHATIFLVDVASRAAGRIVDVSLGGCRIRTHERFPVGIYRRVEVEFVLDGLPFRLGGVTQSLHDRQTVGIRFLDLSDRKREQLTMLVEEIDQIYAEKSLQSPEPGPLSL